MIRATEKTPFLKQNYLEKKSNNEIIAWITKPKDASKNAFLQGTAKINGKEYSLSGGFVTDKKNDKAADFYFMAFDPADKDFENRKKIEGINFSGWFNRNGATVSMSENMKEVAKVKCEVSPYQTDALEFLASEKKAPVLTFSDSNSRKYALWVRQTDDGKPFFSGHRENQDRTKTDVTANFALFDKNADFNDPKFLKYPDLHLFVKDEPDTSGGIWFNPVKGNIKEGETKLDCKGGMDILQFASIAPALKKQCEKLYELKGGAPEEESKIPENTFPEEDIDESEFYEEEEVSEPGM